MTSITVLGSVPASTSVRGSTRRRRWLGGLASALGRALVPADPNLAWTLGPDGLPCLALVDRDDATDPR
ncbi:MAG: hypothetical protein ACT4QG_00745 [Sporichthyaceae bacterium]